jgi:hypothetical protein
MCFPASPGKTKTEEREKPEGDRPVERFLQADLGVLPLATLCKLPEGSSLQDALREVVQAIDRRLAQAENRPEAIRLMTAAYILTGLRVKKSDLASIYRGVGLMQESTAFDEAVDHGRLDGQIRILLRLGRKQFGPADPAAEADLRAIKDLERLERLADAILTANSWQELLMTP